MKKMYVYPNNKDLNGEVTALIEDDQGNESLEAIEFNAPPEIVELVEACKTVIANVGVDARGYIDAVYEAGYSVISNEHAEKVASRLLNDKKVADYIEKMKMPATHTNFYDSFNVQGEYYDQ